MDIALDAIETSLVKLAADEEQRMIAAANAQFSARVKPLLDKHCPDAKKANFADVDGQTVIQVLE